MTSESRTAGKPPQTVARVLTRVALTVVGVIGGLLCVFVCQDVFAGYPQYHTAQLSILGMILISLTGGVVWIMDERRIDAES
jgi:hypothetical protein